MRSVFLCDSSEKIEYVYSPETVEKLRSSAGLEEKIYSSEEVRRGEADLRDADYIFSTWGMPGFAEDEIREFFPNLKGIFYAAGSVQHFARAFLNCGVKVFSAWAANAVPVAEYTVAQIILANKGFYSSSRIMSSLGREAAAKNAGNYPGNYGAKIGIIGAGMIGKLVIGMLKAYKLPVLVFDPFLPDEKAAELGVSKTSLQELFSSCQVVSNHLANNEQTKGMLKLEHFAAMKPYSTFINTGRGAQVVEQDLIKVLSEREDITAILDVTFPEPPEEGSLFYSLPNCILTPHIAGSSGEEVHRMAEYMEEEFSKHIKGLPTDYEVSMKMLETMA